MAAQRSSRPSPQPPADRYSATDDEAYYGYSVSPDEPTLVYPVVAVEPEPRRPRRRGRRILRLILILLVLLVLLLGVAGAAVYEDPALLAPVGAALLGTQPGTVPWNGHDPLNILILGIDQRTNEQTRSDTMIVLRVDPSSPRVEMLSVPRDLYIDMPSPDPANGYGYYKINAGYALGQPYGKGPQLAQLAVEDALHIPINYYAVFKFSGFQQVIDAMGGVNICVPQAIDDPTYPAPVGNGYDPLHLNAGCQDMDGTTALKYARERHVYAQQDLGRIQSQQAVMEAVEKKLLSPGTLLRAPAVLSAAGDALITDMPRAMLPQLGLLLGRAKGAATDHRYLDQNGGYVQEGTSDDGQDVLFPNWDKIRALSGSLFADPRLQAEHATVQVRDGQSTGKLAAMYAGILGQMGFNTGSFPQINADHAYARSLVVVNEDLPGADYTAHVLAQMLQADVSYRHIGTDHAQVVVILGSQAAEGS